MSAVHQIYCTHCTYATSALQKQPASQLADRTLGYSARAASMNGEDLREYYRQIGHLMYYYLPSDTPAALKIQYTATSKGAPRRLIFCPAVNDLQVVAQVCYRQRDTAGRPGSYFGHALVGGRAPNGRRWTTLECLKLWGAPQWIHSDPAGALPQLPAYESLADWKANAAADPDLGPAHAFPLIDDDVLNRFVTLPSGDDDAFGASFDVIPSRMREMGASERVQILVDLLHCFLDLDPTARESLLLVAEPGLAALLFYGVIRLIPPDLMKEQVSFSTYEPEPDRLLSTLAATCFHDERRDLPPEMYRGKGAVFNLWNLQRRSAPRTPRSHYAELVGARLSTRGITGVDELHAEFADCEAQTFGDLDAMAQTQEMVTEMLAPDASSPRRLADLSPIAAAYLRRALHRSLWDAGSPGSAFTSVVGPRSKAHLRILKFLAADDCVSETDPLLRSLADRLPDSQLVDFVNSAGVQSFWQQHVVKRYVTLNGTLPAGLAAGSWLPKLLITLPNSVIERYSHNLSPERLIEFIIRLGEACQANIGKQESLAKILVDLNEDDLCRLLTPRSHSSLLDSLPQIRSRLAERMTDLFDATFANRDEAERFAKRLEILQAGRTFLGPDMRRLIDGWKHLADLLKRGDDADDVTLVDAVKRVMANAHNAKNELPFLKRLVSSFIADPAIANALSDRLSRLFLSSVIDEKSMTATRFSIFLLSPEGRDFFVEYPAQDPVFRRRLLDLLDTLQDHPKEFERRIEALRQYDAYLPSGQDRREEWSTIYSLFRGYKGKTFTSFSKQQKDTCQTIGLQLAGAIGRALPATQFPDYQSRKAKHHVLCRIGESILGESADTPLYAYCGNALRKIHRRRWERVAAGGVLAALIGIACFFFYNYWNSKDQLTAEQVAKNGTPTIYSPKPDAAAPAASSGTSDGAASTQTQNQDSSAAPASSVAGDTTTTQTQNSRATESTASSGPKGGATMTQAQNQNPTGAAASSGSDGDTTTNQAQNPHATVTPATKGSSGGAATAQTAHQDPTARSAASGTGGETTTQSHQQTSPTSSASIGSGSDAATLRKPGNEAPGASDEPGGGTPPPVILDALRKAAEAAARSTLPSGELTQAAVNALKSGDPLRAQLEHSINGDYVCATLATKRPDEISKIEAERYPDSKAIKESTSADALIRIIGLRHQKDMLSESGRNIVDATGAVPLSIPEKKPREFTTLVSSDKLGLASSEDIEMTLLYPDGKNIVSSTKNRKGSQYDLFVPRFPSDTSKDQGLLIVASPEKGKYRIRMQWKTPEAEGVMRLRQCVLQVNASGKPPKSYALQEPLRIEPVALSFDQARNESTSVIPPSKSLVVHEDELELKEATLIFDGHSSGKNFQRGPSQRVLIGPSADGQHKQLKLQVQVDGNKAISLCLRPLQPDQSAGAVKHLLSPNILIQELSVYRRIAGKVRVEIIRIRPPVAPSGTARRNP